MKIVWFSWKDIKHPQAGGAERVTHELAKRLVANGHSFVLITSKPAGLKSQETIDGYKVQRAGGQLSVYIKAWQNYRANHQDADLVIEEINVLPFFTQLYAKKRRLLFFHQLTQQVWFYQMMFPFSLIGFLLEPFYLWFLRKNKVITVSNSTKQDLMRFGFSAQNIAIISEGTDIKPVADLKKIQKYKIPTLLSFGSVRPMKRTLHQVKAFEIAKKSIPKLELKIAGDASGRYAQKVLRYIRTSPHASDIEYLGKINEKQKIKIMQQCHTLLVTSIKEGWGLVVTESASQGTPAIAYNVDGLRDSVIDGKSGYLTTSNNPQALAVKIKTMLSHDDLYKVLQNQAWQTSQKINFNQSYEDFCHTVGIK